MQDTYKTIAAPSEGIYKEKGSKFLAYAFPINNKKEAEENIALLRKKYFDARHHCYAWQLHDNMRISDDGEPSGTAGKPINGQILSYKLTNILIVVVRYFGGVLLGTGGLTKAYKQAAAQALQNATIIERIITENIQISFPYEKTSSAMKILKENNIIPSKPDYNESGICTMSVQVRLKDKEKIKNQIAHFS
jgi:uncharacterized YigZ family protein